MKYLKMLGLAAVAAMALMAVTAGAASATTLSVGGVTQSSAVQIGASLAAGSSAILKDSFGTTTDTCTESSVEGETEGSFSGATVGGKVSGLSFKKCSHTTTVISNGSLSVAWTSGTNGTVSSAGAEVTVNSTAFGASAVCKTGAGTAIGTATGVASGNATIDINGKISCGILGTATWTGTYTVTSPSGLGVES
ncbi:MAG TPA: hypothetical protein VFN18_09925 [Solirubrobacterales bacterium]|nr:hypothetical protein [Solirubrobacterales bacterium]